MQKVMTHDLAGGHRQQHDACLTLAISSSVMAASLARIDGVVDEVLNARAAALGLVVDVTPASVC